MPEVVEIRHYADFIQKKIKKQIIKNIQILNGRYKKHSPFSGYSIIKKNYPLKVLNVNTKGKFLYITIVSTKTPEKKYYLLTTLGLTGGWVWYDSRKKKYEFPRLFTYIPREIQKPYQEKSLNHLNIALQMKSGDCLYFFDTLSFGTFSIITDETILQNKLRTIGPDIMSQEMTFALFCKKIQSAKNSKKVIGNVLMDQKTIAGIGNYLRADILWVAKVSPFRLVRNLSRTDLKRIYQAAEDLTWGEYYYGKKHKIMHNIKLPHDYGRFFYVYQQKTDIYGNPVKKEELYEGSQKRFIHWVPKRQK
jgi:formamidopyrimidine-DNA glycosylase